MREALGILFVALLVVSAVRAICVGELRFRSRVLRRSEQPLLFFVMIATYLLTGLIVVVCVTGYLPALIGLTL